MSLGTLLLGIWGFRDSGVRDLRFRVQGLRVVQFRGLGV